MTNMIEAVLTAAGVPHKELRYLQPPSGTFAVWTDDISTDGPDGINAILVHDYTVELYEAAPDAASEAAIEDALDDAGLRWAKQARYWLQTEQLYQIIYETTHIEKKEIS